MIKGLLGTEVLWIEGQACRVCQRPATHFWVRQVNPDEWTAKKQMTLLHTPYCTTCSPAVADHEKQTPPPIKPRWRRVFEAGSQLIGRK